MMAKISEAYQHHNLSSQLTWCRLGVLIAVAIFTLVIAFKFSVGSSEVSGFGTIDPTAKYVKSITWNVAAINNNPFEYWITNDENPNYNKLMSNVSNFIESPGSNDVKVGSVFTDTMFEELAGIMTKLGWGGVNETRRLWQEDFSQRSIINGFVKDGLLGKKRLASMPDRVTNTIHASDGSSVMRPTVINCYDGDLSTLAAWWKQWKNFFFERTIQVKKKGEVQSTKIHSMLSTIKKSKYPALSAEEEAISIPLQTMAMAIFDAILVHMMSIVGPGTWQALRTDMCQKLNHKKNDRTVEILQTTYAEVDIQFLQEVAGNFKSFANQHPVAQIFEIHQSASMDTERDQNSYILLKKGKFRDVVEVTDKVLDFFSAQNNGAKLPLVNGDLIVLVVTDAADGTKYILASFHGDTNGLATKPIVSAVRSYAVAQQPNCKLLFGLDANTYSKPEKDQQGVVDFGAFYTDLKLNSCYGPHPNPLNFTTFHARTHLQPQLNKAVSLEEKDLKGDKNPKDFILFFDSDFTVVSTTKDNTGKRVYIEGMVFPTLTFPSDHGITSTILKENGATKKNLK